MFANLVSVFTPKQNEQPPAKAADLTISSKAQLIAFANDVNSGNDYSGKTVCLSKNIDMGGVEFSGIGYGIHSLTENESYRFNGMFDGCNFTISNYSIIGSYYSRTSHIVGQKETETHHDTYSALFINIGENAIIKNLKIMNFSSSIVRQSSSSSKIKYYYHISGLVSNCFNGGNVENCMVVDGQNVSIAILGEVVCKFVYANCDIGVSGEKCLQVSGEPTQEVVDSVDPDIKGGADITDPWYYNEHYNDGWPYLRSFIKSWYTYQFKRNVDSSYDNSKSFTYPYTQVSKELKEMNGEANVAIKEDFEGLSYYECYSMPLVLYGGIVEFEEPSGCEFAYWTYSYLGHNINFIAHYNLEPFDITFMQLTGTNANGTGTYTITQDIDIRVSATAYKITYSFIDESGVLREVTYQIKDSKGSKYFNPSRFTNLTGEDLYSDTSKRNICPELSEKKFGINFS